MDTPLPLRGYDDRPLPSSKAESRQMDVPNTVTASDAVSQRIRLDVLPCLAVSCPALLRHKPRRNYRTAMLSREDTQIALVAGQATWRA